MPRMQLNEERKPPEKQRKLLSKQLKKLRENWTKSFENRKLRRQS